MYKFDIACINHNVKFGLLAYAQGKLWFIECVNWMRRMQIRPVLADSVSNYKYKAW